MIRHDPGVCRKPSWRDLASWWPRIGAAGAAVARELATLERTAAGLVDLPGATGREGWEALAGSPDELADGLRDYARAGISPVVLWLAPGTARGRGVRPRARAPRPRLTCDDALGFHAGDDGIGAVAVTESSQASTTDATHRGQPCSGEVCLRHRRMHTCVEDVLARRHRARRLPRRRALANAGHARPAEAGRSRRAATPCLTHGHVCRKAPPTYPASSSGHHVNKRLQDRAEPTCRSSQTTAVRCPLSFDGVVRQVARALAGVPRTVWRGSSSGMPPRTRRLSSAASRLCRSSPQRSHRWMMTSSPFGRWKVATGAISPPQALARSPILLSSIWRL